MDIIQTRTGLLQLQHDAQANSLNFNDAYQNAQQWVESIRREASFQPLKEGVAMTVKPLPLLRLENDIEELMQALKATTSAGRAKCAPQP